MRRLLVTALALVLYSAGCVSDNPTETTRASRRPSAARSRYRPYRAPVPPPAPPVARAPTMPPPKSYAQAWFPAGQRISSRWTTVVIHHSATARGGAQLFDQIHREKRGWDELGYHFVIGNGTATPDGLVEVGPRWHKQKHGAHCKTPGNYYNEHGIGICLVGDFTKTSPTPRQMASLNELLRFLAAECRIPSSLVTTHGAVTGKTECPGHNFNLTSVRRTLASNMPSGPDSGRTASLERITSPAGPDRQSGSSMIDASKRSAGLNRGPSPSDG